MAFTPSKIAVVTASLRLPLRSALATAGRLGARGVELDARTELRPEQLSQTALRQLRKILDDFNLRVSAVAFPTRRGYEVADDLERRIEATKRAMKLARDLRADVLVNQVGCIPQDEQSPQWRTLIEALTDLGAAGLHYGVTLAARTGSEDGASLARLLAALPEGTLGVDLDPGSLLVAGHPPSETIESVGPHIVHVHATDGVRDPARARALSAQVGRGSADYPRLLGLLEEHNYHGWFTIEHRSGGDPAVEMGQTVQFLESLVV